MIALTYDKVDQFVAKLQRKGADVRFVGWDMVFFKSDERAQNHPAGRRRGDAWGFETVVSPNSQGKWLVNYGLTRGMDASRR
jgi:hypothetical protein